MGDSLPPTTVDQVLKSLERLGDPKLRAYYVKNGAPENLFGVKMGDIRNVAKGIKTNHELGLELWKTGNLEARLLTTLIVKPKQIPAEDLERMVSEATYEWLADWLVNYVVKQHPEKESLRQRWMHSSDPMIARAGWSLTTERVCKDPDGLDLPGLLDRLDREMGTAPAPTQWTMNFCLGETGIRFPEHRQRAIAIGEKHGLYRDWPQSKGCTIPYVPVWIDEIVSRSA
jgi:3-methyladenine DNA glycosylase AlkD